MKTIFSLIVIFFFSFSVSAAETPTGVSACESSVSSLLLKQVKADKGETAKLDKKADEICKKELGSFYTENGLFEGFVALQVAYRGSHEDLSPVQKEYMIYLSQFAHYKVASAAKEMYNF
jgi:hypothetical protein